MRFRFGNRINPGRGPFSKFLQRRKAYQDYLVQIGCSDLSWGLKHFAVDVFHDSPVENFTFSQKERKLSTRLRNVYAVNSACEYLRQSGSTKQIDSLSRKDFFCRVIFHGVHSVNIQIPCSGKNKSYYHSSEIFKQENLFLLRIFVDRDRSDKLWGLEVLFEEVEVEDISPKIRKYFSPRAKLDKYLFTEVDQLITNE